MSAGQQVTSIQSRGASDIASYERDGFLSPLDVLSADEVAEYREHFEAHLPRLKGRFGARYKHKTHLMLEWVDRLVHHPKVLGPVTQILGEDVLCWTSNFFLKEPGDGAYVSWHQDSQYWNLDPPEVLTAWIALAPSTQDSGCLRVIPGSHEGEEFSHRDTFDKANQLTRGQAIEGLDEASAVNIELLAGQMSLHHIKIVHGSERNISSEPRVGLAIRYASTRVQALGRRESALLVCGEDSHRMFAPEERPQGNFTLPGRMAQNRALRRQVGNNYQTHHAVKWHDKLRLSLRRLASESVLDGFYLDLKLRSALGRR